jgi:hypothetical protein
MGLQKETSRNLDQMVKRPLGRPRSRWQDNIKMNLREIRRGCMEWIYLVQYRDQWRDLVVFHKMLGNSWEAELSKNDSAPWSYVVLEENKENNSKDSRFLCWAGTWDQSGRKAREVCAYNTKTWYWMLIIINHWSLDMDHYLVPSISYSHNLRFNTFVSLSYLVNLSP